jgi:structural maintenance of chromosome 4
LGRLGDLGSIDKQYQIAITAASFYLNHIVVDTIKEGEKCIKYLRDNNLGHCAFIVLEQVKKNEYKKEFREPPNSKRIFDLVKVNNAKLMDAFYLALRNTLVCLSYDDAEHLAYGMQDRFRVVTLTGEVFEPSGIMTAGKRYSEAAMGELIVEVFTE